MELLAAASDADHLKDIADTCFGLDESVEHIREKGTLSNSRSWPSLAEVGVVHTKSFGQGGVNVIHEDASDVNGVFFEVVEGANSVEEGGVVDLRSEVDLSTVGVDVALPNVIEHIVRLKRIAGN